MVRPTVDADKLMVVTTVRVTPVQQNALKNLSDEDLLPIQEHIRRAVDQYLDSARRRKLMRSNQATNPDPNGNLARQAPPNAEAD